ncbi:FAD-binding oxidoreductase [uncultured Tateyamaria sp.]|uniref:NAD(P)/FAD-dependent oxidoreductase n=1 Tax=uncultured Tateyamaria sp. TaxID=455651 RepID=UPI0026341237|nr:FAD-binding oxidoreductase [uncultured Tateyamaria sp.]
MTFVARRLPSHRGPAAWAEILGPGARYPRLEGDLTADVVVIGAGFAGLSAARRVLQLRPDARVVVLEAGRIAEGAAGRNSGFMIDLPHDLASEDYAGAGDDRTLTRLNRAAIAFGQEAVAEYGLPRDVFDPAGKVNGAATAQGDAHNRSYAKHLASLSEPSEWLDAQGMHALTGSRHYRSGLYTPGTVMLQPAGYIRGLAAGLQQRAQVFETSPVLSFARAGPSWTLKTPKGRVVADQVITAVNGHLESFGIASGRLLQLFLFASMTAPLDADARVRLGGAARWGVTPSDPMGTTMRRIDAGQGGHRIITRTAAVVRPSLVPKAHDMRRAARLHVQKFTERFPTLSGVKQQYTWGGHLCLSLNGVAHTREVDHNLFSACVQNGLGTARGTLTGIAAAERACGHTSDITRYFDAEDDLKRLPPQPFATWGANAFLRWKEWRAGAE